MTTGENTRGESSVPGNYVLRLKGSVVAYPTPCYDIGKITKRDSVAVDEIILQDFARYSERRHAENKRNLVSYAQ